LSRRGNLALWAGGLLVALVVLVARVAIDGRAALRAGEAAEGRGDRAEATRQYLDAARFYLPGSGTVSRALEHLDGMARGAEAAGAPGEARAPLEAIRAALLGTRSFYTPHARRLPDVERRLAEIYARVEDPGVDPGASHEARVAWHASRLARHPGPSVGYVVMALVGLALWLLGAVGFLRKGVDAGLRLRRGVAVGNGVLFLVGVVLFVVGLRLG
jgi:hypothetical protein